MFQPVKDKGLQYPEKMEELKRPEREKCKRLEWRNSKSNVEIKASERATPPGYQVELLFFYDQNYCGTLHQCALTFF